MGELNKCELTNWMAVHTEVGKRGLLSSLLLSI